ncbi:MAG: aminomethyl-transferring glycine dehydrogenase [Deltaproteobacteria bacterium]|nr:aminomethyl-transferring glycine dehydrogenase [Deltaproteobacteria bacterium]
MDKGSIKKEANVLKNPQNSCCGSTDSNKNIVPVNFASRHLGPVTDEITKMLSVLGFDTLEALVDSGLPTGINTKRSLDLGAAIPTEYELLQELGQIAQQNKVYKSFLGMGYYGCATPAVILRHIFENPTWYTQYTPYQAEIAQGHLEALLNFQTMVAELCALPVANASLLDEATAAAEAMMMCYNACRGKQNAFYVDQNCHPQVMAVVATRARALGINIHQGKLADTDFAVLNLCGALLSYPGSDGQLQNPRDIIEKLHTVEALAVVVTDPLALCLITPPGEFGADIVVGSAQRFGVPMGYGGPHAAFMSTTAKLQRLMPGRIVGVSKDAQGKTALRLALQTREQHIRREKATSNICTSQALLAIMASMYAVYHGPRGLRDIAKRVHGFTVKLANGLQKLGWQIAHSNFFDTLHIITKEQQTSNIIKHAQEQGILLRELHKNAICISCDELTTKTDIDSLLAIFSSEKNGGNFAEKDRPDELGLPAILKRNTPCLKHAIFGAYHSETEIMRYIHRLAAKDLALNTAMIPLGSCTMKLNSAVSMLPLSWPQFANLHPFAPRETVTGYTKILSELEHMLAVITGLPAVSLQPNAGSQGEYTGLLVIRGYHDSRGDQQRRICLIPQSSHGTNPASAAMAGLEVVVVACDAHGNINYDDLCKKAQEYVDELAALMLTYPSTHGVFEEQIIEICNTIHKYGGLVYMDGANLNALVGLTKPSEMGADVCHVNLHKTFAIPHGGGGPGMGPIAVTAALAPFLPTHPVIATGSEKSIGTVAAAPFGSASILPISWVYIKLMGSEGLKLATQVAILNANYIAKRLEGHYQVVYRGKNNLVAHELIIDLRPFKTTAGIEVDDIAKRLMDYGFHAPTVSWPVPGTMMIEPTESEPLSELDRFCEAMIAIRQEIEAIANGQSDRQNNVLKLAPHTAAVVSADNWDRPYSREQAAYPSAYTRIHKYWPSVGRIDNAYGDRNFVCTCPTIEC